MVEHGLEPPLIDGQLAKSDGWLSAEGPDLQASQVETEMQRSTPSIGEGNMEFEIVIGLENLNQDPAPVNPTQHPIQLDPCVLSRPGFDLDQNSLLLPFGPALPIGPAVRGACLSNFSEDGGLDDVLSGSKANYSLKKPKKGTLTMGAARCLNRKDMVTKGGKQHGKGGDEEVTLRKNKGKAEEVVQEVSTELNPNILLTGSGVNVLMDNDGTTVPETPINLMGDLRRKKVDAEHLLEVAKKDGITFTLADGRVVDRLVVSEDADVANREIRERLEGNL